MKEIITTCFVLAYSMGSMMAKGAAIAKTEGSKKSEAPVWKAHCYYMADLVDLMKENEGDDGWIYLVYIDTKHEYQVYEGHITACEVLE